MISTKYSDSLVLEFVVSSTIGKVNGKIVFRWILISTFYVNHEIHKDKNPTINNDFHSFPVVD